MDNKFLASPRRARLRMMLVVGVVAVVAAGVFLVVRATGSEGAGAAEPGTPRVAASVTDDPDDGVVPEVSVAPTGAPPLRLVRGRRTVNGVSVGYPHTRVGAVSAAAEYLTQLCSTLDPQRAAAVGVAIADGSFGDTRSYFAEGPVNSRRELGLVTDGPVPAGASMTLAVMAYQLRDVRANQTTVLLLGYLTTTTATQAPITRIGVFPMTMVWRSQDWKFTRQAENAPGYARLRLRPGSSEARAAGWLEFTR